jgi:CRP-like cAMP-binding protein
MEGTETPSKSKMSKAVLDFLIQNIPILSTLRDEELKIIGKYLNYVELAPEKILFREGDSGGYVCFVVDGSLEVLKKSESGEGSMAIATLSKGDSMGEMAAVDDLPRSATLKALTKAKLVTLSKDNLDYLLADHPKIGVKILKGIARSLSLKLRDTSTELASVF